MRDRASDPLASALAAVSAERAAAFTLDLVRIRSYTGETREVAQRFVEELRSLGFETQLHDAYRQTPVVIGRLRGTGGGPTLILNGHLDTVPIPHAEPERRDGFVYGRGAADMKGPIAAAVEAVRAARVAGLQFRGDLLFCAHGLHEAPGGTSEDLAAAIADGAVQGDAAVVLELGHDSLVVVQLGMGIFRAVFRRAGAATHELKTPDRTPNPALAAAEAALALEELDERLRAVEIPHAGRESVFLGQIHAGDFYNRHAESAWIEGTRRYSPERRAADAERELRALLEPVASRRGVSLELSFHCVREGCRIDESHPLSRALRLAYQQETGEDLPVQGSRVVADAGVFHAAGIPCLYHGLAGEGAHADVERVSEAELSRGARTYLRLLASYVGICPPSAA
ncbi:MAG: M20 family metallopeptidase [Armatimonadota bacterium]